ncbi:MAG: 4Fe-4S binding protein [Archaeoglobus sp.]|nr:4Fe-4S binding protein [Archaeoglobus sp.]
MKRMIIAINEDLCVGCGRCVNSCPTNALELRNEKAALKDERICDGFGSCIAVCPENALYIEEREAEPFDWDILAKIDFEDFIEKLSLHYKPQSIKEED